MWTWFVNLIKQIFGIKDTPPPVTSTTPPPAPEPPPPVPPSVGFVHREGTTLVDGKGNPVELKGVNVAGWLQWEGWMWAQGMDYVGETPMMKTLTDLVGAERADQFREGVRANFVTSADFNAMHNAGLNVVRVPFHYRLLEDDSTPGVYREAGWGVLDRLLSLAEAADVYVVLDLHAAPCGQSLGFTADYTGPNYMWLNAACMDRGIAMWKAIAQRYANRSVIAGYDLLNEVVAGDGQLLDWYTRATKAIRSVDTNHLIIYEGNNLAHDFAFMKTPIDANGALSIHDYAWMKPGEDLAVRMPTYAAAAKRLGMPIWVGEFGMNPWEWGANGHLTVDKYVKAFDAEPTFAGYALWCWKAAVPQACGQFVHTKASKVVVDWIAHPTGRVKPTPEQADLGLREFLDVIRWDRTKVDSSLVTLL